jgi:hypothetical protein
VWHPFSLASSSADTKIHLQIGIRGAWPKEAPPAGMQWKMPASTATWTYKLLEEVRELQSMSESSNRQTEMTVKVRGPYGALSLHHGFCRQTLDFCHAYSKTTQSSMSGRAGARFHHGFCCVRVNPIGWYVGTVLFFTMDSAVLGLAPFGCGSHGALVFENIVSRLGCCRDSRCCVTASVRRQSCWSGCCTR